MTESAFDTAAFTAFETKGWGGAAASYLDFVTPVTGRLIEPLLDAAEIGPGKRVLDIATGPGLVAARAAERGATVVGADAAPEMVSLAASLHPDVEFLVADAESLPFEACSFDAAVAGLAILHLARPERAVAEWVRVLEPGGRLAVSMWADPAANRWLGLVLDAIEEVGAAPPPDLPAGPPLFRFSDEGELAALLTGAGLGAVTVSPVAFVHRFPGAEATWQGILESTVRTAALVVGQPAEVQERLRDTYVRLAREHERNGWLELPVAALIASGRRP